MSTALGSLLRRATSAPPYNILTAPTHERFESGWAGCNARFYAYQTEGFKTWNSTYASPPENYTCLPPNQLPIDIDFDLVIAQNKAGQFQKLRQIADLLQLPLVTIEHTAPYPNWSQEQRDYYKTLKGDLDVFICDWSREEWGWPTATSNSVRIIHHGVDTDLFCPNELIVKREMRALSVVNDWINRDQPCGFRYWQEATQSVPTHVLGDTPGLSKPAKSTPDLIHQYRKSQVFVNTSLISPYPTALLEAMACECAVVTSNTCYIPSFVKDGENGVLCDGASDMNRKLRELMGDEERCRELGRAARQTVIERFGMDKFVKEWNQVFEDVAN